VFDVGIVRPDILATCRRHGAVLEMPCHSLSAPLSAPLGGSLARPYTHGADRSGIRSFGNWIGSIDNAQAGQDPPAVLRKVAAPLRIQPLLRCARPRPPTLQTALRASAVGEDRKPARAVL
jgi:hypothetical protein